MNVAQLIEVLQKMPPEALAEVYTPGTESVAVTSLGLFEIGDSWVVEIKGA